MRMAASRLLGGEKAITSYYDNHSVASDRDPTATDFTCHRPLSVQDTRLEFSLTYESSSIRFERQRKQKYVTLPFPL